MCRLFCMGLLLLAGCTSVDRLPASAAEIDFSEPAQGQTGWSRYEQSHSFAGSDLPQVLQAAQAALTIAGYELKTDSSEKRAAIGKHGITFRGWQRVVGIYLDPQPGDIEVRIMLKSATDPTSVPDWTLEAEANKLLDAMQLYLDAEAASLAL